MIKTVMRSFALLAALNAGCGGDDEGGDEGDGGARDGGLIRSDAGDAGSGSLRNGTYEFSNVNPQSDGCELDLEDTDPKPKPLELRNTGTQFSLGKLYTPTTPETKFTPGGYSFGSGGYSTPTTANLSVNAHVDFDGDTCEWDMMRTTSITYTGVDKISVDLTEVRTNITPACQLGTACSSKYTFDLIRIGDLPEGSN